MTQQKKTNDDIRKKLRARRMELGLKQTDVAIQSGISESSITMIERGAVKNPKPETIGLIAKALGIELESLYETGSREVITVGREMINMILDSEGDTYEPRGLFVCMDIVDGERVYTAVRNLDGSGETEEFRNKRAAERWLEGYPVQSKCFYRKEKETDDDAGKLKRMAALCKD